jgi:hypothetical protein
MDEQIHIFLTSAAIGDVSFTPRPLYPRKKSPSTHWMGGWVDPRAGVNDAKKENSLPYWDLNSDPSFQPIASHHTGYTIRNM